MNKRGQALVEFILIMPIVLFIISSLIDIGNIFVQKYNLNNDLETITSLYQNNKQKELKAYIAKENITYNEKINNDLVTITLNKKVDINTPVLNNAIGKDYKIEVKKTIYE